MPNCKKIRSVKRQVCAGDLNKKITLFSRAIKEPGSPHAVNIFGAGSSNYSIDWTPVATVFAMIDTAKGSTRGVTQFDGVNTERPVTHIIYIRFKSGITEETWIEYNDRRFDILSVENMDERSLFLKLLCNERGLDTKNASLT